MSDILIRGMEMPEKCGVCPCFTAEQGAETCNPLDRNVDGEGQPEPDCPLHELPEHGDLIEAEHLAETLDYYIREAGWGDEINEALRWVSDEFIKSETVIVPASEEVES